MCLKSLSGSIFLFTQVVFSYNCVSFKINLQEAPCFEHVKFHNNNNILLIYAKYYPKYMW